MKDLNYYMGLNYTYQFRWDPIDDHWFAKVVELPGCMSQGDSIEEALSMVDEAMEVWIELALEDSDPIPEPPTTEDWEENRRELHAAHIPLSE